MGQFGLPMFSRSLELPAAFGTADRLKSDVADMVNAAEGPWGGALTAALFLKEFVPGGAQWAHFDIFCWQGSPKPGRPKGGDAVSLRATFKVLKDRYGK